MSLAGILAFAGVVRGFAFGRAFAGIDAHAMDRSGFGRSRRHGNAIQGKSDRRGGEGRAGNEIDLHSDLLENMLVGRAVAILGKGLRVKYVSEMGKVTILGAEITVLGAVTVKTDVRQHHVFENLDYASYGLCAIVSAACVLR